MARDWPEPPPDKVSPEEKDRRRRIIRGWTFKLRDEYDVPFANHCMAYLKGYTDEPPPGYTDPSAG